MKSKQEDVRPEPQPLETWLHYAEYGPCNIYKITLHTESQKKMVHFYSVAKGKDFTTPLDLFMGAVVIKGAKGKIIIDRFKNIAVNSKKNLKFKKMPEQVG